MKNFLIKSICLVLVTVTTFSLCGCFETNPKELEIGDFRVTFKNKLYENEPDAWYLVLGLSEVGKKKKEIILPKEIDGRYYYIEDIAEWAGSRSALFEGEMEKFYIEYTRQYSTIPRSTPKLRLSPKCINLKKVILNIDAEISENYDNDNLVYYYNCDIYKEKIKKQGQDENIVGGIRKLANLQLLYNYNESPNEGYFWIDDIDNGEKVEVIPDTPEREGYTFGGWYTEEECENKFDFNTVFNKPVLEKGDIYPDDYVTYLYAKWIQNEG